jgi:hypothetical protein
MVAVQGGVGLDDVVPVLFTSISPLTSFSIFHFFLHFFFFASVKPI